MADDKTGLPEGTDKVIAGASAGGGTSGTGTGGGAGSTGSAIGGGASGAGSPGGGGQETMTADSLPATRGDAQQSRGGGSGGVIEKLRTGGEKLGGQAADKARDLVSQGLERSAEALANVGRLIGDTATGLDERLGAEYGDYARRAASTIENTANSLASKDPDELIDDTRNLVRKSPGVALAGAAIVGFALARLVKTGFETSRGSQDRENGGTRGDSRPDNREG